MLRQEDYIVIKALHQRGVYQKDIAEELGVHPKTVSRALQRGGAPTRRRRKRGSKLDAYKARVDQLLSEGVWNAVVILREIQAEGYVGGLTLLRDYIRPKRPLRKSRATVRFETGPGKQMQSDWGEVTVVIGGQPTKVHFIVNQLIYSRRFHFWRTDPQDAEHTYEGIVWSLEYFGGAPQEVLVDNQKSTVLKPARQGKPTFPPAFSIWRPIMALPHAPVVRTVYVPRARTNAWSAISSSTSLCAIGPLRVRRISTSWLSVGWPKKPTDGCSAR